MLDFQAIEVLERATRVKPVAPLFILLGKTNMKARRFDNAIRSFDRAIQIMVCNGAHETILYVAILFLFFCLWGRGWGGVKRQ